MTCLQNNMEHLRSECLNAVVSYTRIEAQNTRLNTGVARACHDIIDKECADEVEKKDEGSVMHCLIEFKAEQTGDSSKMDEKCAMVIEHWQILTMQDWKFSNKFKKSCQADVKQLCGEP